MVGDLPLQKTLPRIKRLMHSVKMETISRFIGMKTAATSLAARLAFLEEHYEAVRRAALDTREGANRSCALRFIEG